MNSKRNQYVNLLKGISCIIVVFLHCPFPGIIGDGIIYGLRFSVPIFFMISGYYSYYKDDKWIINKAKFILRLLLVAELFYGIWTILKECIVTDNSIKVVFLSLVEKKNIWITLLCGTMFNGTLWYLYAMFWTWVLMFIIRKTISIKKCYMLIPVLLLVQVFGRFYIQNNYDINSFVVLFRNAITFGLPFCLLGNWIADKETDLLKIISVSRNIIILVVGFFMVVIEFLLYGKYMDTHISTIVISFGLFLFAIRQHTKIKGFLNIFVHIGSKWYVWIYLSHVFFIDILSILYKCIGLDKYAVFQYLLPILVLILSCCYGELMFQNKNGSLKRKES